MKFEGNSDTKQKKRICMVTNWYPSKKNPYRGVFFKEQAFAMAKDYDFLILHYNEKKTLAVKCLIKSLTKKNIVIEKINAENNTVEYNITTVVPLYTLIADAIYDLYVKKIKHINNDGIGKYVSPSYKKMKRKNLNKIFTKMLKEEFDLLYCVSAQNESYTLKVISDITNRPYVVAEHSPFPWPGSVIKDTEHDAICSANLFLAISYDKIRQVMIQNIQLKNIAYVGNMVDESQFNLTKGGEDKKTFIIVASNVYFKNYSLLIEIFSKLKCMTDTPFKLMVVGYSVKKERGMDVDELEREIRGTDFSENVEFIPEISHDEIHKLYERADAFVMTSIQEGMPVSAIEAACCGLPIFSTRCGGVEDYVNEDIGRIYNIVDAESFADGLKQYLEGDISFDSQYIRQCIIDRFGKATFVERMSGFFSEIIENS